MGKVSEVQASLGKSWDKRYGGNPESSQSESSCPERSRAVEVSVNFSRKIAVHRFPKGFVLSLKILNIFRELMAVC